MPGYSAGGLDKHGRRAYQKRSSISRGQILNKYEEQVESEIRICRADFASGDYKECISGARGCLRMLALKSLSDKAKHMEKLATLHGLMGDAHFELQAYHKALECYQKQLKVANDKKWQDLKLKALENIGQCNTCLKQYDKAISVWSDILKIDSGSTSKAKVHHDLGYCLLFKNDWLLALQHAKSTRQIAVEENNVYWQVHGCILQALANSKLGAFQTAKECFQEAQTLAVLLNDQELNHTIDKLIDDVTNERNKHRDDREEINLSKVKPTSTSAKPADQENNSTTQNQGRATQIEERTDVTGHRSLDNVQNGTGKDESYIKSSNNQKQDSSKKEEEKESEQPIYQAQTMEEMWSYYRQHLFQMGKQHQREQHAQKQQASTENKTNGNTVNKEVTHNVKSSKLVLGDGGPSAGASPEKSETVSKGDQVENPIRKDNQVKSGTKVENTTVTKNSLTEDENEIRSQKRPSKYSQMSTAETDQSGTKHIYETNKSLQNYDFISSFGVESTIQRQDSRQMKSTRSRHQSSMKSNRSDKWAPSETIQPMRRPSTRKKSFKTGTSHSKPMLVFSRANTFHSITKAKVETSGHSDEDSDDEYNNIRKTKEILESNRESKSRKDSQKPDKAEIDLNKCDMAKTPYGAALVDFKLKRNNSFVGLPYSSIAAVPISRENSFVLGREKSFSKDTVLPFERAKSFSKEFNDKHRRSTLHLNRENSKTGLLQTRLERFSFGRENSFSGSETQSNLSVTKSSATQRTLESIRNTYGVREVRPQMRMHQSFSGRSALTSARSNRFSLPRVS